MTCFGRFSHGSGHGKENRKAGLRDVKVMTHLQLVEDLFDGAIFNKIHRPNNALERFPRVDRIVALCLGSHCSCRVV